MKIKLSKTERIIAVVPSHCAGPGWSNRVIWVYIEETQTKELRTECIQQAEQTKEQHMLFEIGAIVCAQLIGTIGK